VKTLLISASLLVLAAQDVEIDPLAMRRSRSPVVRRPSPWMSVAFADGRKIPVPSLVEYALGEE